MWYCICALSELQILQYRQRRMLFVFFFRNFDIIEAYVYCRILNALSNFTVLWNWYIESYNVVHPDLSTLYVWEHTIFIHRASRKYSDTCHGIFAHIFCVLCKIFSTFTHTVKKHDYHDCTDKICNQSDNICRSYKIFIRNLYLL